MQTQLWYPELLAQAGQAAGFLTSVSFSTVEIFLTVTGVPEDAGFQAQAGLVPNT